jgi:hypothetical protein
VSGAAPTSWILPLTVRRIVGCVMVVVPASAVALQNIASNAGEDTVCIQTCKRSLPRRNFLPGL